MREIDLPQRGDPFAFSQPSRGGGPFPYPVHAEHRCLLERAGIEGCTSMRAMMLAEQQFWQFNGDFWALVCGHGFCNGAQLLFELSF